MDEASLWAEIGGAPTIRRLVSSFYKQVATDDILGPMYPQDEWEEAEQRLRDFLCFRLGGDHTYLRKRGHPRLRMRHAPFAIDIAARDRWLLLMRNAMEEIQLPATPAKELDNFFVQVADFLRNRPEQADTPETPPPNWNPPQSN